MTFLPHGIGIALSKEVDMADWARVRQGNEQIALEKENLKLSQLREQRLLDEAERAKREADWQYYKESIERPGQILSPRLEEDYVKTVFEPTITEMGQMWTSNMGIRDKTDYPALTEFEKKSNLLTNNTILADASYLQKQKDAYEAYKVKNGGPDEFTRQFETELEAFESRATNTVPTFLPYKFDPIALVNSIKDNIQVDYKKGQKVGEYIEMEGVFNDEALTNAAKQLYAKDEKGWLNFLKGDPYLQSGPEEAIKKKIEQMTALESKWLPAYNSSNSSTTQKTPMRNMLLDFVTNPEFYNNKKQQASKTAVLAPHGNIESFDGQVMPHLTVASGQNVFAVEIPEGAAINGGQVMELELPTDLNYRIVSGNGLRFYDGSENGVPPAAQNIYTSIRVEVYDPTSTNVATGGINVGKKADPIADLINKVNGMGLNATVKEYTVGTGSPVSGIGGSRQIKTTTIDLVVPIDWSNASAFNEQFMTQTQAAEVNTAFGAITEQNFDLPVIGVMTDANVDYDVAGTFLASYAAAKGLGEDLQAASTQLRKEYKQYNDSQPAGKKVTFEEYFAKLQ